MTSFRVTSWKNKGPFTTPVSYIVTYTLKGLKMIHLFYSRMKLPAKEDAPIKILLRGGA